MVSKGSASFQLMSMATHDPRSSWKARTHPPISCRMVDIVCGKQDNFASFWPPTNNLFTEEMQRSHGLGIKLNKILLSKSCLTEAKPWLKTWLTDAKPWLKTCVVLHVFSVVISLWWYRWHFNTQQKLTNAINLNRRHSTTVSLRFWGNLNLHPDWARVLEKSTDREQLWVWASDIPPGPTVHDPCQMRTWGRHLVPSFHQVPTCSWVNWGNGSKVPCPMIQHIHTHTHTHSHTHTHIHTSTLSHIHSLTQHTHIHTYIHSLSLSLTHTHTWVYAAVHARAHARV